MQQQIPKVGDRVRVTGVMNDPGDERSTQRSRGSAADVDAIYAREQAGSELPTNPATVSMPNLAD